MSEEPFNRSELNYDELRQLFSGMPRVQAPHDFERTLLARISMVKRRRTLGTSVIHGARNAGWVGGMITACVSALLVAGSYALVTQRPAATSLTSIASDSYTSSARHAELPNMVSGAKPQQALASAAPSVSAPVTEVATTAAESEAVPTVAASKESERPSVVVSAFDQRSSAQRNARRTKLPAADVSAPGFSADAPVSVAVNVPDITAPALDTDKHPGTVTGGAPPVTSKPVGGSPDDNPNGM